jgi:2-polyprenyl-3-methyl-5-hydroxy-6-metoxy-1,4-benzoquinol methylase
MKNLEFYKDLYEKLYQVGYHSNDICHTLNLFPYISTALSLNKKNKSNPTILDVGCSHGLAVKKLIDLGFDAYGIDVAPKAIELCRDKNNLNTCKLGSATSIPFEDNFFDLIISSDTLEHILPEDMNITASEFKRVSKGPCLVAIALDPEGDKSHLSNVKKKFNCYHDLHSLHTCLKSTEDWDKSFKKAGFKNKVLISNENFLYIVVYF